MSAVCPIRNVLDQATQATLLPVISEMLLIHWSAAFGGSFTLVLDQSIIVLLVCRLCGYFVDHVAVYESSGTFTRSFFSACRCTRSQDRCASPCPCSVTQARVVSGTHMCLCLLLALLFSCLLLAMLFSPSSSKLSILPKLCWLQLELCSLHGVAAHALHCASAHSSLCLRTLFTCRGCVSRVRMLWVVTPFQATTTLLLSSCVHLT